MPVSDPSFVPITAWPDNSTTTIRVRFSLKLLVNAALTTATNYAVAGNTVSSVAVVADDPFAVKITLGSDISFNTTTLVTITTGVIIDSTNTFVITSPGNTVNLTAPGQAARKTSAFVKETTLGTMPTLGLSIMAAKNIVPLNIASVNSVATGINGQVTVSFSSDIVVGSSVLIPSSWNIVDSMNTPLTISSISVSGINIILTTTTQQSGGTYTITVPSSGIADKKTGYTLIAPFVKTFTGAGNPPNILNIYSIDEYTLQIQYNTPVNISDALNSSNYNISGGIQSLSVNKLSPTVFNITTTKQAANTTYNITVSNVRDLSGNII